MTILRTLDKSPYSLNLLKTMPKLSVSRNFMVKPLRTDNFQHKNVLRCSNNFQSNPLKQMHMFKGKLNETLGHHEISGKEIQMDKPVSMVEHSTGKIKPLSVFSLLIFEDPLFIGTTTDSS
jgi:hypothetical protein